jgi:hypothetical protein
MKSRRQAHGKDAGMKLAICESGERHLMVHRSGALKWIGKTVEHRPSKTNHETNHNSAAGAGS